MDGSGTRVVFSSFAEELGVAGSPTIFLAERTAGGWSVPRAVDDAPDLDVFHGMYPDIDSAGDTIAYAAADPSATESYSGDVVVVRDPARRTAAGPRRSAGRSMRSTSTTAAASR